MVSAWWLLVAASGGIGIGMFLTALMTMVAGKEADIPDREHAPHPVN